MGSKQKVIIWLIIVVAIIVIAGGWYLVNFITSDTLSLPPKDKITKNLFIEKHQQDIESLRTTKDFKSWMKSNEAILLDLNEDRLNGFLDDDLQENDKQYNTLCKQLNFVYTEQFIALANKYFEQPEWNNNVFLISIIDGINANGFVERGTPVWKSLQEFQNNISCYNEMTGCISKIGRIVSNIKAIIPVDEIRNIETQKQILITRSCLKNVGKQNELINSFDNLIAQAKENALLSVSPTQLEYESSGGNIYIKVHTNVSSWTFGGVYSWLSISRNGSNLSITCTENTTEKERNDRFTIEAFGKRQTIEIKQKARSPKIAQIGNISGSIEKVWVDHNEIQNGKKGMKIHLKFSVNGMLNKQGRCIAWFYFSDGTKVNGRNSGYITTDGQLSVGNNFTPIYENSIYYDFVLFMPYDEFLLTKGRHKLKFCIGVLDHNKKQMTTSDYVNFELNQP